MGFERTLYWSRNWDDYELDKATPPPKLYLLRQEPLVSKPSDLDEFSPLFITVVVRKVSKSDEFSRNQFGGLRYRALGCDYENRLDLLGFSIARLPLSPFSFEIPEYIWLEN